MKLVEGNNKLFAIVYGLSGSGKTHLCATYCQLYKDKNVLLIDVDQGSATLKAKDLQDIKNLYAVSFDKFNDLDQAYELCKKNTVEDWIKAIPELKDSLTKPFDCIIWDTWTELQWEMQKELRKTNRLTGSGLTFRQNIQLQHWGQMTDLNKLSAQAFKELPIDVIFVMQSVIKEDESTGQVLKGPAIHGKLVTELPALFTTIVYTYNNPKGEYCATTLPRLGWPAKVRGVEGRDIVNPTWEKLFN